MTETETLQAALKKHAEAGALWDRNRNWLFWSKWVWRYAVTILVLRWLCDVSALAWVADGIWILVQYPMLFIVWRRGKRIDRLQNEVADLLGVPKGKR